MGRYIFTPITVALITVAFGAGIAVGLAVMADGFEQRAVERGKAEFYIDDEHKIQWRWLP
jgi:hypothetical protein